LRTQVALDSIPLFAPLEAGERQRAVDMLVRRYFSEGETLIRVGEVGTRLFLSVKGNVKVFIGGKQISIIENPALLGEKSVIDDVLTTAKCIAAQRISAYCLDRNVNPDVFDATIAAIMRGQGLAIINDLPIFRCVCLFFFSFLSYN
jgi:signal-transduction protein with cAMP-binding, CBS, and nucleotidyltransferase domain